jgi:basic amino acid/polyamine antiporter, APA family
MATTATGDRVFLRKASGLIKTASNTDVFIYDIGLVSIGLGLGFLLFFGPAFYLGGNLYVATLLAGAAMLCVGLGMICWTITIPRSGGIYNFGTRSMWPPLAFTLSFVEVSAWLFYGSFGAVYLAQLGIAPAVTTIGIVADKPGIESFGTDLAGKWGTFGIGSAALVIGALILASGMRRFFFSQKVMFSIAVIGTLIFLGTLIATSRSDFVGAFNSLMGKRLNVGSDAYHGVITAAQKGGWSHQGFDWKQTIYLANWAFLPLIGAAFSISIGGEIKQVTKGQTVGILAAIVGSVVVWIISFALVFRTMGSDFLGAVTYSNLNGVEGAATPVTPFPTLLTGLGANSVTLTILIALGFIGWIWLWIPTQILYPTRAIVAWSLDRVAPDALGRVSNRTHTPIPAIVFSLAGGITFVGLLAFTSFFQLVIFIEVAVLAWAIVLLAGVFFPYRRPDIYDKSPIANLKIAGLPVMTVACAFGSVAAFLFFFDLFFDSFAAGHSRHSLSVLIGWFVGAFVIFWVMKLVRRRQGIDVDLAFKEIPVE